MQIALLSFCSIVSLTMKQIAPETEKKINSTAIKSFIITTPYCHILKLLSLSSNTEGCN